MIHLVLVAWQEPIALLVVAAAAIYVVRRVLGVSRAHDTSPCGGTCGAGRACSSGTIADAAETFEIERLVATAHEQQSPPQTRGNGAALS